jgi:hypothetical protein
MTTLIQFSAKNRILPINPVIHEAQRSKYSKQTHSCCSHYTDILIENITCPYVEVHCLGMTGISAEYSLHLPPRLLEELLCAAGQKGENAEYIMKHTKHEDPNYQKRPISTLPTW